MFFKTHGEEVAHTWTLKKKNIIDITKKGNNNNNNKK